jgi:hypothetical protein
MSSKHTKDTFEPLKIETTLLKIEIKTIGDVTTKEYDLIPFHPNMADMKDLSNNNYILFPSFVKISMKDLQQSGAVGNAQDYKKVFTTLDKFINLIKYVTRPNKEEEDFTLLVDQTQYKNYAMSFVKDFTSDITSDFRTVQKYEPLTEEEIISNNIGLIKSLFFPVNGRFFVLGHDYVISKSQYIPPYKPSADMNPSLKEKKEIPLHYDIVIELQLLDATNNPNIGDFSRLSCKAKKNSITNDIHEMFYTKIDGKERPKVVLPLLTVPTATSKRGFGKLQLEWEERNKFVKQALTEKERQEQENKKTSLQKKMDKFEKKQEEYNKIPPLWTTEVKALIEKYSNFEKVMKENQVEYKKLKDGNFSLLEIDEKIKSAIENLIASASAITPEIKYTQEKMDTLFNNFKSGASIANDPLINDIKKKEKDAIDFKYVAPFIIDIEEKKKDVAGLQKEYANWKEQVVKDTGTANAQASQQEMIKVQNRLIKAQTDYEILKEKLGDNGEKLIESWTKTIADMETFKESIQSEKTVGERKILDESVNIELKKKMEEINKLKKTLYLAKFKEGNINEVTKSERDKFEKEPTPVESVSALESNLASLEEDYLDIAKKISQNNKIQGIITLLTADLNRIKNLKNAKESEKKTIDSKIKTNSKEISDLTRAIRDPKDSKDPNVKRVANKQEEQAKYENMLQPRIKFIDKVFEFEQKYDTEIKKLRQAIKDKNSSSSSIIKELRTAFSNDINNDELKTTSGDISDKSGGGVVSTSNNITRRHNDLKKKNTRRRLIKLKKLIKTLKRHYKRKKKHYTHRHRD